MVLHLWPSVLSFCSWFILLDLTCDLCSSSASCLWVLYYFLVLFSFVFYGLQMTAVSFLFQSVLVSSLFCVSCMMSVFSPCWFPFCLCVLLFPHSITSRFILIVFCLMCVVFSFARGVSTLPSSPLVYLTPRFVSVLCFVLPCHAFSKKHFLL